MKRYTLSDYHDHFQFKSTRLAVRALILDSSRTKILTQFLNSWNITTIPGGGVEEEETLEDAIIREVLEETGFSTRIITPLCEVEEFREHQLFHQINTFFVLEVDGIQDERKLSSKEQGYGISNEWLALEDAYTQIYTQDVDTKQRWFVQQRDILAFNHFFENYSKMI